QSAIGRAVDLLAYRYSRIRQRLAGAGMAALTRAVQEELQRLVQLGLGDLPLLRRKLIIRQVAQVVGLDEETIARSIPGGRRFGIVRSEPEVAAVEPLSTRQRAQVDALGCLMCEPSLWLSLTDAEKESLDPAHLPGGPA